MRLRSLISLLTVSLALALVAAGCGSSKSSSSSSSSSASASSSLSSSSSAQTTPRKHHTGRKVAAVAGGAALAHHIHKKHTLKQQARSLHAGQFCTRRKRKLYKSAHFKCVKGHLRNA